jgi:hypothetical protein
LHFGRSSSDCPNFLILAFVGLDIGGGPLDMETVSPRIDIAIDVGGDGAEQPVVGLRPCASRRATTWWLFLNAWRGMRGMDRNT